MDRTVQLAETSARSYNASKFFVAFGVVSSLRCFVVYLTTRTPAHLTFPVSETHVFFYIITQVKSVESY